ncbi:MAG: hypothetical protein QF632_04520 [Candidatus Woesearchaeota archaeon]|jgi:YafQ family addiction module toxin component|nr:hypothetical protein [Candidatus Woesearchaeota archaeon]|tara:strand:- start:488 stop:766 length:279 start_codon:yes stop_codon:yes gene_type:complete
MYQIEARKKYNKIIAKLQQKNPKQLRIIQKKLEEIEKNPHRFKNLRSPLQHLKRVHIDKHFVLTFSIDEENKKVILEDYEHHDVIYGVQFFR